MKDSEVEAVIARLSHEPLAARVMSELLDDRKALWKMIHDLETALLARNEALERYENGEIVQ